MPRYSAGIKTGTPGTPATFPYISLFSAASVGAKLREVGLFNTSNTAIDVRLVRLTAQGTPGTGLTEAKYDPDSAAAACTAFTTHTAAATVGDDLGYRASLGAAIGAGVILTFGDSGIRIPTGTANGVGVIAADSSGVQPLQAYLVWDE
jgi:hypothetical protein